MILRLDHSLEQFVDLVFAVSEVSTIDVVVVLLAPSSSRCVEFEGPEEVVAVLEDATNGVQLVDQVFDALDVVSLAQFAFNHEVVGDRNATAAVLKTEVSNSVTVCSLHWTHLDEATLVEQVADCLEGWIAVGDVRLGDAQHVEGSLVELHEGGVVDLAQAEQLQDLLHLRGNFVDTKIENILRSLPNLILFVLVATDEIFDIGP